MLITIIDKNLTGNRRSETNYTLIYRPQFSICLLYENYGCFVMSWILTKKYCTHVWTHDSLLYRNMLHLQDIVSKWVHLCHGHKSWGTRSELFLKSTFQDGSHHHYGVEDWSIVLKILWFPTLLWSVNSPLISGVCSTCVWLAGPSVLFCGCFCISMCCRSWHRQCLKQVDDQQHCYLSVWLSLDPEALFHLV